MSLIKHLKTENSLHLNFPRFVSVGGEMHLTFYCSYRGKKWSYGIMEFDDVCERCNCKFFYPSCCTWVYTLRESLTLCKSYKNMYNVQCTIVATATRVMCWGMGVRILNKRRRHKEPPYFKIFPKIELNICLNIGRGGGGAARNIFSQQPFFFLSIENYWTIIHYWRSLTPHHHHF